MSEMTEDLIAGSIDEIAEKARALLIAIVPDAWCNAQGWDNRLDCGITLGGRAVAEMIPLHLATERRIRECAERLLMRQKGVHVDLVSEMPQPIRVTRLS